MTNWTSENYPAVREHLSSDSREVFDEMAEHGLRLLEVAGTAESLLFRRRWHRAVKRAGLDSVPPEQLRIDYIISAKGAGDE